ncbi:MAG TPA: VOC family protein [bacterium]|jgi:hypothetical protein
MSEVESGSINWRDLTVPNADEIKDFYCEVVGWKATDHDMGEYNDYNINLPESGDTVAGICHARGSNSKLPPQWLLYVSVDDVAACSQKAVELGGEIIDGPRMMGNWMFCVIQDPAGAYIGLISK